MCPDTRSRNCANAGKGVLSAPIGGFTSSVNRFLPHGAGDPAHVTLVAREEQDFVGGFYPSRNAVVPVVATTAYLYARPPLPVRAAGRPRLWHARVQPRKERAR